MKDLHMETQINNKKETKYKILILMINLNIREI